MKKIVAVLLGLLFVTGCGASHELVGKWETKYELGMYGEITQKYEFKKDKTCKKTLITDQVIETDCTYVIKDNKVEVKYDDKTKTTLTYSKEKEKNKMKIDGYVYDKK